jgi:two-component system alkaline phosphatase synthesis response regulator PhoP
LARGFAYEKIYGHRRKDAGARKPFGMATLAVKEKRRILIVDDDRDSTHLIKILLEKVGSYLVLEENDAANAHQNARNFRPDLILLDITMPQRDGGEIAAEIEADLEFQRTPIVFLTALVTKAEAKAGLRIQGHPVLAKPISIPELINKIEENLPGHAA